MKKPEKSKTEQEREEKEFIEKNRRELNTYCEKCCREHNLDFEPPFTHEEREEILAFMRKKEEETLLKNFPNFYRLTEWEQLAAKAILKFGLDPKEFSLARKDWPKINEAIGKKLGSSRFSEVNSDVFRFKR